MLNYCEIPCCLSSKPEQIALALTGIESEMSVSWVTALNATASSPCVSYVLSSAAPEVEGAASSGASSSSRVACSASVCDAS